MPLLKAYRLLTGREAYKEEMFSSSSKPITRLVNNILDETMNVIEIAGLITSRLVFVIIERNSISFIPLKTVIAVATNGKNNKGISLNLSVLVFRR